MQNGGSMLESKILADYSGHIAFKCVFAALTPRCWQSRGREMQHEAQLFGAAGRPLVLSSESHG